MKSAATFRSQNRHRNASGNVVPPLDGGGGRECDCGNMNLQSWQYKRVSFPGHRQTGTKKSFSTLSYSTRSARELQLMHLPTPDFTTWRTWFSNPPAKKKNIFQLHLSLSLSLLIIILLSFYVTLLILCYAVNLAIQVSLSRIWNFRESFVAVGFTQ